MKKIGDKILTSCFVVFFLLLYVPLFALVVFSFNNSPIIGLPWKGFTTKWYTMLLSNPAVIDALKNSLIAGLATAFLATLGGLMAAFALVRHRFIGRNLFTVPMLLPMVLPGILIGIALLNFFNYPLMTPFFKFIAYLLGEEGPLSLGTVVIAHTLLALPYSTLVMMARLIGFDRSLEEAAMDLGADELTTFRKVTFPLIMPGIFSSAFLAFTISLSNISTTYFIIGYRVTLPIFVYSSLRHAVSLAMLTALSTVMLSFAFILSVISGIRAKL